MELPSFSDPGVTIKFQISDVMHSALGRIVYRAESRPPGLDLAIKVTRSYSTALHDFCARRGHAPTIRGFKTLPGNIVVIAMDYLEGDHLGHEGSQELRNEMARQLKELVNNFHLAGYVHGDLRLPNIYHVKDKIMLLDFDWADQVGKAFYPYQTLNPVLTEGRDMDNLMITVDDDERVLKMTLESIGCS